MKKTLFIYISMVVALLTACNDDAEHVPGLWTESNLIETFAGDTVHIVGQASNYVGISTIDIICGEWGVSHTYDLRKQEPKVFNYDYALVVPADATFDSELMVVVTDTEGSENKRTITLKYKPDTEAPQLAATLNAQTSVELNTTTSTALYALSMPVTDDRSLKSATIDIAALGINETVALSGRSALVARNYTINQAGSYTMCLTLEDNGGNSSIYTTELVVMPREEENPIADYAQMYVFDAEQDEADYIYGFYHYMDRNAAYQYSCRIYAPKDGAQLLLKPTQDESDDLYGVSPYVGSKLMNNKDYVVPITVATAGYYWLRVDLQNHAYTLTPYEVEPTIYTGALSVTGEGFATMADWAFSPTMSPAGTDYRKTIELELREGATTCSIGFCDGTWNNVWRCGSNQWWWLDNASYGGSVGTFDAQGVRDVTVTFDTAELWCTIRKR